MRALTLFVATAVCTATTPAWSADTSDVPLEAGTVQLGGAATLRAVSAAGETDILWELSPSVGVLVADQGELFGAVSYSSAPGVVDQAAEVGLRFYGRAEPVWIYGGAAAGYQRQSVDLGFLSQVQEGPTATPLLGVMVPLAANVALDLGTRLEIAFAEGEATFTLPVGALGIRAFLP